MMYSSVRYWTIGPKKIGGRTSQIEPCGRLRVVLAD